jgi:hypothetical protein
MEGKLLEKLELLTQKMEAMDDKMTKHGGRLDQAVVKVDLALEAVGKLQQDQLQAARLQKSLASSDQVSILGSPSAVSLGNAGVSPPPPLPPPPPPRFHTRPVFIRNEAESSQGFDQGVRAKSCLPKMDFPRFDGSDVRIWLDMCETYFDMYQIPAMFKVSAAVLHMSGNAAQWYQSFKLVEEICDWSQFRYAVALEFESTAQHEKVQALQTLRQTGSVADYKSQFDSLVYQVHVFDPSVGGMMLLYRFILGLKEEIRSVLLVQLPDTVQQAAAIALVQESVLLDSGQKPLKKLTYKGVGAKVDTSVPVSEPSAIQPERAELWKAKQLKEYRRANGFCFKRGDKYSPDHQCVITG